MSSQFFENEPREICSHLKEGPKFFFVPDKLEKHTRKEKGKWNIEEWEGGKEAARKEEWL